MLLRHKLLLIKSSYHQEHLLREHGRKKRVKQLNMMGL